MFWTSVGAGLEVLLHWETYAAGLVFILLTALPVILAGSIAMNAGRAEGAVGCLTMLILPIFEVFALMVFVLTLSPIMLGLADNAAWSFPWMLTAEAPWATFIFVLKVLAFAIVLTFVPIVGRLQAMQTLLVGALALALVIGILEMVRPEIAAKSIHYWPGFWFFVGLLVVGSALAVVGTLVAGVGVSVLQDTRASSAKIFLAPIAASFGFVPLFIYGAWLGCQVRG